MHRKHKQGQPFYWSAQWKALRRQVLNRDGYACTVCHVQVASSTARVDHIIPRSRAPHLELVASNCRVLCTRCDAQSHRERATGKADRIERFVLGHDANGLPRDCEHLWNRRVSVE